MIANLLLAAGASSRMEGRDKLLEPIEGAPLLAVLAQRALSVGPTVVTLPSPTHKRRFVLPQAAQIVVAAGQMSDSLKTGIAALPAGVAGVMILPADMPDITAQDIAAIHRAADTSNARVVRATTQDGLAGHPIYFAASEFSRFETLTGDRGAYRIAKDLEDHTEWVMLSGDRARLDLDTPQDWAAYRAR